LTTSSPVQAALAPDAQDLAGGGEEQAVDRDDLHVTLFVAAVAFPATAHSNAAHSATLHTRTVAYSAESMWCVPGQCILDATAQVTVSPDGSLTGRPPRRSSVAFQESG
jgi:hypothetical protein